MMSVWPSKITVIGAGGFIGKNFCLRLDQFCEVHVVKITKDDSKEDIIEKLACSDLVFHFAGVNRSDDAQDFFEVNADLTQFVCQQLENSDLSPVLVFSSSTKVVENTPYGSSKKRAEEALKKYHKKTGSPVVILRLPGVYGKWAKPNYNSVVATFCSNRIADKGIVINDPNAEIELLYIDDLLEHLEIYLRKKVKGLKIVEKFETETISVGELATNIELIKESRKSLTLPNLSSIAPRGLYSTYISYLNPENVIWSLNPIVDQRGSFFEFQKFIAGGQVSFFTINVGQTRGGHYHNSKFERFVLLHGESRFRFFNPSNGESFDKIVSAKTPSVLETPPGWAHEISNLGEDVAIFAVWANEIFDPKKSDTIRHAME